MTHLQTALCSDYICNATATVVSHGSVASFTFPTSAASASGRPLVAFQDLNGTTGAMRWFACADAACSSGTLSTPLASQFGEPSCCPGQTPAFARNASAPLLLYYSSDGPEVWATRCNDTTCAHPLPSVVAFITGSAVTAANALAAAAGADDLALSVVSGDYGGAFSSLRIAKCANAACNGYARTGL